jgi:hypothetical protein
MKEMLAKGLLRGVIFSTEDCDATFEHIASIAASIAPLCAAPQPASRYGDRHVPSTADG